DPEAALPGPEALPARGPDAATDRGAQGRGTRGGGERPALGPDGARDGPRGLRRDPGRSAGGPPDLRAAARLPGGPRPAGADPARRRPLPARTRPVGLFAR